MEVLSPDQRIDWFRVLEEIRRENYSLSEIAYFTSIPKSTLLGYRNLGAEPRHAAGVVLIRFWSQVTLQDQDRAPTVKVMPTAADFRR